MKFNEYMLYKSVVKHDIPPDMSTVEFYNRSVLAIEQGVKFGDIEHVLCSEHNYIASRRPFYNVYPSVTKCLKNTSLDFSLKQLKVQQEPIAVCFAVGDEIVVSNSKIHSMIIEFSDKFLYLDGEWRQQESEGQHVIMLRICMDRRKRDGSFCHSVSCFMGSDECLSSTAIPDDKRSVISVAVGVLLLAGDERFTEPILLADDENRKFKTKKDYDKAVEKARRRGRNGHTIGKGFEVSPHMRRPHFAIRWTEKGRSVPKLVPVKGCVVSRKHLFPIPTGHIDECQSTTT